MTLCLTSTKTIYPTLLYNALTLLTNWACSHIHNICQPNSHSKFCKIKSSIHLQERSGNRELRPSSWSFLGHVTWLIHFSPSHHYRSSWGRHGQPQLKTTIHGEEVTLFIKHGVIDPFPSGFHLTSINHIHVIVIVITEEEEGFSLWLQ